MLRGSGSRCLVAEGGALLDIEADFGIGVAVGDQWEAELDLVLVLLIVLAWLRIRPGLEPEPEVRSHRPMGCRWLARGEKVLLPLTLLSSVSTVSTACSKTLKTDYAMNSTFVHEAERYSELQTASISTINTGTRPQDMPPPWLGTFQGGR
jgi:hypothetical protein